MVLSFLPRRLSQLSENVVELIWRFAVPVRSMISLPLSEDSLLDESSPSLYVSLALSEGSLLEDSLSFDESSWCSWDYQSFIVIG
jgi:hypothetical protein